MSVVAILKIGALGDVLRTTAFLPGLRAKYPGREIWWVTAPAAKDLFAGNPHVDKVLTPAEAKPLLEAADVELCLSLEDDPEIAALGSSIGAGKIVGAVLNGSGKATYTADSAPWFGMGILNRDPDGSLKSADALKAANRQTYQRLMGGILGLPLDAYPDGFETLLSVSTEDAAWAREHLTARGRTGSGPLLGLNPSSGARWSAKRLGLERSIEVARALREELGAEIVLFGGPEEADRQKAFVEKAGFPVIDAGTGHSLKRFAALVAQVDALVTADSLALHVGNGTRRPIVVFFGPTSAHEIELHGRGEKLTPPAPCDCFYRKECAKRCIDTIPVEDFVAAVDKVLKRRQHG